MILMSKFRTINQKIRKFIHDYITEIVLLMLGVMLISYAKTLPYVNLLLIRPEVEFFLVFLLIMILFSTKIKNTIFFILIVVFSLLFIFSLAQSKLLIEYMGNLLYAFLLIGFINFLVSLRKKR